MTTIWIIILFIGVLIFVHELGHFFAARSVGVRVERFSIGIPPRLVSLTSIPGGWELRLFFYRRDEHQRWSWGPVFTRTWKRPQHRGTATEYALALIPLGGYVKMSGMIDESLDTRIERAPYELLSKSPGAQLWVLSAGVIMNVLLAYLLFTGVVWHTGVPESFSDAPVVGGVMEDMPAAALGLQAGDRIVAINDMPVSTWTEMTDIIFPLPDTEIHLEWERDGTRYRREVVTGFQVNPVEGRLDTLGIIGIEREIFYRPVGLLEAARTGGAYTLRGLGLIVLSLRMIATGDASLKDIGGPIAISELAGQAARRGWVELLSFMALISVNLAFINILPIPGLDGGHLMITVIEALRRKPLSVKARTIIQQIGMALLLVLMITVIFNDLTRLFGN